MHHVANHPLREVVHHGAESGDGADGALFGLEVHRHLLDVLKIRRDAGLGVAGFVACKGGPVAGLVAGDEASLAPRG